MFEGIKRKYLDWVISGIKTKRNGGRQFVNWADIQDIVVLLDQRDSKEKTIKYILEKCSGKRVKIWTEVDKNADKHETVYLLMVSPSDCNLLGKPNDQLVSRFLDCKADVLIDLTSGYSRKMRYLLAVSNAKCKCGLDYKDDKLHDFRISLDRQSPLTLLDQIMIYLEMIKTS